MPTSSSSSSLSFTFSYQTNIHAYILYSTPNSLPNSLILLQQMTERTFIVIFFFWAVLTILTPTLIILSESSKLHADHERGGIVNARRMMGYAEKQPRRQIIASVPAESPAPAPVLESVLENRWSGLRRMFEKR